MFTAVARRTNRLFWRLSVAVMLLITAADAFLGSRVILIGLLMVGPCSRSSAQGGFRLRKPEASLSVWPCYWLYQTEYGAQLPSSHSPAPS